MVGYVSTEMCCRCLERPATSFSGHLSHGVHIVTCGWCPECSDELHGSGACDLFATVRRALGDRFSPSVTAAINSTVMGWRGHWIQAMGLRIHGSPTAAAVRAAKQEQRIAREAPPLRERLARHCGRSRPASLQVTARQGAE